jgi:hypothetical protein
MLFQRQIENVRLLATGISRKRVTTHCWAHKFIFCGRNFAHSAIYSVLLKYRSQFKTEKRCRPALLCHCSEGVKARDASFRFMEQKGKKLSCWKFARRRNFHFLSATAISPSGSGNELKRMQFVEGQRTPHCFLSVLDCHGKNLERESSAIYLPRQSCCASTRRAWFARHHKCARAFNKQKGKDATPAHLERNGKRKDFDKKAARRWRRESSQSAKLADTLMTHSANDRRW